MPRAVPGSRQGDGRRRSEDPEELLEPGPPPLITENGYILLIHNSAAHDPDGKLIYRAGQALTDPAAPTTELARLTRPFLVPETPEEISGRSTTWCSSKASSPTRASGCSTTGRETPASACSTAARGPTADSSPRRGEVSRVDQVARERDRERLDLRRHPIPVERFEVARDRLHAVVQRLLEGFGDRLVDDDLVPGPALAAAKQDPPLSIGQLAPLGQRDRIRVACVADRRLRAGRRGEPRADDAVQKVVA